MGAAHHLGGDATNEVIRKVRVVRGGGNGE